MPVSLPCAFEKRHSVLKNFHIFFSNFKRNIWLVINPPLPLHSQIKKGCEDKQKRGAKFEIFI
ncbi:MAG TPA: hypothetical protein DCQ15_00540 [Chitinophagaceae bacterium]|nr:hypothetical protein [Chitinophagaceae bacterium]